MDRVKKRNVIIALLVTLICFIAAFFFIEKKETTISASAERITTIDGFKQRSVQIANLDGSLQLKFNINLTQEMSEYLSEETYVSKGLFKTYYRANLFYLRATKLQGNNVIYRSLYHIDTEHSDLSSEKLYIDGLNAYIYIPMGGSSTWATEYSYKVEFGHFNVNDDMYSEEYGLWTFIPFGETVNSPTFSVQSSARNVLNKYDNLPEEEIKLLNIFAGYGSSGDNITVNLKYKTVVEYGRIEEKTEQYQVNSLYAGNSSIVYDEVMSLKGVTQKTDFNAIYVDSSGRNREIILQVDSYTYEYDQESEIGTLTITYRPFEYKSFAIRLQDNNTEDALNLYYYIRCAGELYDETGRIVLRYYFSDIVDQAFEDLGWIFEIKKSNINIVDNTEKVISIYVNDKYIDVSFNLEDEDDLKNLNIFILTEITPDHECNVDIKYTALSFEAGTIVDREESFSTSMMYSEYIKLCNFSAFKASSFYKQVTDALKVDELGTNKYFIPTKITGEKFEDGFKLSVGYDYYTLIQITESSGKVFFRSADAVTLSYSIAMLGIAPPAGTRIKNLSADESQPVKIDFNEDKFTKLKVTLDCNSREKRIIPLSMEYSNSWYINIVYKETYKDTPFAIEKEELVEFTVGQYDPKNLTISDVKKLLGRSDDMKICGIAIPDNKVDTEFTSDSTYTATVSYGVCSLKQIDYNGYSSEIRVPLTSYDAWCNAFGDDMTILMLNTTKETFFEYANEIDRDKLYGFFSIAIFEEQVTDLNYWFRSMTGDGNVVVFEQRETVGSDIYKFFDRLAEKNSLLSVYGYVGMTYCEILNDQNHKQHSVFFYMDATSGYVSDGGAQDRDDNDGAFENTMQDITSEVIDWLSGVGESLSNTTRILRIVIVSIVAIAAAGGIAYGVIWLIKYYKKKE